MGNKSDNIPLIVRIAVVASAVTYRFFTPWYIRLWHNIKRLKRRHLNKQVKQKQKYIKSKYEEG